MEAIVIYESLTGNTRSTADAIAAELQRSSVSATVCPITAIDHQALSDADLVIVGSWTDGMVLFGQRPGRAARLQSLPVIDGKKAAVFCSYAINPGRTLEKMDKIVTSRGGDVIGGMAIKRNGIAAGAAEMVDRLLGALDAAST